ncbi:MAG: hypothetical protein ABR549_20005 [Mycobacteriales bacterium]
MADRELCVRVVDPALDLDAPMWGDAAEGWVPPAWDWVGTLAAAGVPYLAGPDASSDDGKGLLLLPDPDAVDHSPTAGRPLLTGAPPAAPQDRLRVLAEALGALVVPDLRGVLLLRLDDPGAAVKCHLDSWAHGPVSADAWEALWQTVGDGTVSVFCCTGWVDGSGNVRPSREAVPDEWAVLDDAVARGVAELECHGHTHMDPDTAAWAADPARHEDVRWYRELWPPRSRDEPPQQAQAARLQQWQELSGASGTTLVAPGECWGTATVQAARSRGFRLMNSWGVCRLDLPVPTWSRQVGSPYLDEVDPAWAASELPTVGYWHDRDMALHGPAWCVDNLAAWREAGMTRLWPFSRLAAAYASAPVATLGSRGVEVRSATAVPVRVITG